MTIFDFISDVLYKKTGKLMEKEELEFEFQPDMPQRLLSMYSNSNTRLLNATINKISRSMRDKEQFYKLFLTTVPKSKYKKIRYIKKTSKKKTSSSRKSVKKSAEKRTLQSQTELARVFGVTTRPVHRWVEPGLPRDRDDRTAQYPLDG